jgi:hypothetical protein
MVHCQELFSMGISKMEMEQGKTETNTKWKAGDQSWIIQIQPCCEQWSRLEKYKGGLTIFQRLATDNDSALEIFSQNKRVK